jgi:hypothetical protein
LSLEKPNKHSNTKLQFNQSLKNQDYIDHLYALFQEFCGKKPLVFSRFDNRPNRNKEYSCIKFKTASLLALISIGNCFIIQRETKFYHKI